jgi:hypothetical protein
MCGCCLRLALTGGNAQTFSHIVFAQPRRPVTAAESRRNVLISVRSRPINAACPPGPVAAQYVGLLWALHYLYQPTAN